MSDNTREDHYEVGYGKPPKKNRFQKGVSGNPKGRPKGAVDFDQQVLRETGTLVVINENGRQIRLPKFGVALKQLGNKAMKGDLSAIKLLSGLHRQAYENVALKRTQQSSETANWMDKEAKELSDEQLHKILFMSPEYARLQESNVQESQEDPKGS